ncbi:MAG: DNA polymerase III subunit beta [Chromatiales bacterium 21-64-14]|nr:MAG: DNA polymerase III subunit beta [Chromatiales bacterium 21-64-14]HQU15488.1 DNA polymerase III subunit beta [Gammaproteobacteria bacterium]
MKIKVGREALIPHLAVLGSIASKNSGQHDFITCMVRIDPKESGVIGLTVTDFSRELSVEIRADEVSNADGPALVDAHKFGQIIRALPDGATTTIESVGKDGKIKMQSGKSRFLLATGDSSTFPLMDPIAADKDIEVRVDVAAMRHLLRGTMFAMSKDDARHFINGALFSVHHNSLTVVATNGHHLATCRTAIPSAASPAETQVILPWASVLELYRILEKAPDEDAVELWFGAARLWTRCGAYRYATGYVDGRYPDYERIIPKERNAGGRGEVDTEVLGHAVKRTSLVLSGGDRGDVQSIAMSFSESGVKLAAENWNGDTATEQVEMAYAGAEITIGFKAEYVQNVLDASRTGKMTLFLPPEPTSAMLIKESSEIEGWFSAYVIMPRVL